MWEWIQTWTFFNWLAVVAFLMALIGFLNSFLSLKSRYKDWFAIRSKEALRNRLLELEKLAQNTKRYTIEPATLLIDILWETTTFLIVQCMILIIQIIFFVVLIISKVSIEYIYLLIVATLIHLLTEIIGHLRSVRQKMIYTKDSSIITNEAEKLIGAAKRLGLISDEEIITIQQMLIQ